MPEKIKKTQVQIEAVIDELRLAMLENVEASMAEVRAKQRKEKAHYRLLRAKEAVGLLEREIME